MMNNQFKMNMNNHIRMNMNKPIDVNMNLNNNIGCIDSMNMTGLMMDENTIRIKNIVKPYEEKIKKLEDILRKKEFEIVVLKDKIKQIEKKI